MRFHAGKHFEGALQEHMKLLEVYLEFVTDKRCTPEEFQAAERCISKAENALAWQYSFLGGRAIEKGTTLPPITSLFGSLLGSK